MGKKKQEEETDKARNSCHKRFKYLKVYHQVLKKEYASYSRDDFELKSSKNIS